MEKKNNPFNLEISKKYLVRHKSNWSPWIEITIVHFNEDGFPVGKNVDQCFFEPITDEYEIDQVTISSKEEARLAWLERSRRDSTQYVNEDNAFEYYWKTSHL